MLGLFLQTLQGNDTLVYKLQDKPACLFYLNPSQPLVNNTLPTFQAHEINGFKYPIVATDIDTCYYATKATFSKPIIFYMRSLDWLKKDDYYENQVGHYTNKKITYVSASDFIKQEVLNTWGTDSEVIKEIEFEKIYGLPLFK